MNQPMMQIIYGDALQQLRLLPDESVQLCVTSPPYWGLRNYGVEGQLGLEKTPEEFVGKLVEVFREVRRVLKKDGVLFLNIGDSYAGSWGNSGSRLGGQRDKSKPKLDRKAWDNHTERPASSYKHSIIKPKELCGIPWRVAFALQADGWYLRQEIIWHKPNPMPESVRDRCTKAHEQIFWLTKSAKYYSNMEAVKEPHADTIHTRERYKYKPSIGHKIDDNKDNNHSGKDFAKNFGNPNGRNLRSVWTIPTQPHRESHFATFPDKLAYQCIMIGSRPGDVVLDPFAGSGTVGVIAAANARDGILIELNPEYVEIIEKKLGIFK